MSSLACPGNGRRSSPTASSSVTAQRRGEVTGNVIEIALPPGDAVRARLRVRATPGRRSSSACGSCCPPVPRRRRRRAGGRRRLAVGFSPSDEVRLVHAVPRPLEHRARPGCCGPHPCEHRRRAVGGVDVHGPTTARLDADATWTEWIDDPVSEAPEQRRSRRPRSPPMSTTTRTSCCWAATSSPCPCPRGRVRFHASRHELGDTKHRVVDYRLRGTSRFTEYFHPSLVATPADRSVVGPKLRLSIPSSARPPEPSVRDIVPLLRWEEGTSRSSRSPADGLGAAVCASTSTARGTRRATTSARG